MDRNDQPDNLIVENVKKELRFLNEQQKNAVTGRNKKILVLAGAGTGKTKVLVSRISYLIAKGVSSNNILAVTFTNKAAGEMKERLSSMLLEKVNVKTMYVGTFHSICRRIIKQNFMYLGIDKDFQCIDADDQNSLAKRILEDVSDLKDYFEAKDYISYVNFCKEKCFRPDSLNLYDFSQENGYTSYHIKFYAEYEKRLRISNLLDFGDLLLYVYELFNKEKKILNQYQQLFRHVLVDEFQDTNFIQNEIVKMIAEPNYLFVVGDDDQLIYEWRGAEIENILGFANKYDDCLVVRLEENYRSTSNILNAANEIIKNNKSRYGKNLWTNTGDGEKITLYEAPSAQKEANFIVSQIENLVNVKNKNYDDFMILYRSSFISRLIENFLFQKKIPYIIYGGVSFWLRSEIKDVISYLQLIQNKANNIAFERVIAKPKRGFGKTFLTDLSKYADENKMSLFDSLDDMLKKSLIKGKKKEVSENFVSKMKEFSESDFYKDNLARIVLDVIQLINIKETYKKDTGEKLTEREGNVAELLALCSDFENTTDDSDINVLLEMAALQSENQNVEKNAVKLMTIHASKGLECDTVFLMGLEDDIFPSSKSKSNKKKMEEERRLAYVAYTRARRKLYISYALSRLYGSMGHHSIFIEETPYDLIDFKFDYGMPVSSLGERIQKQNKLNNSNSSYVVGDKVFHSKHGYGEVTSIKENNIYLVKFEDDSLKVINCKEGEKLNHGYRKKDKYNHAKFGNGVVMSVQGDDSRLFLKVDFDFYGIKIIEL